MTRELEVGETDQDTSMLDIDETLLHVSNIERA